MQVGFLYTTKENRTVNCFFLSWGNLASNGIRSATNIFRQIFNQLINFQNKTFIEHLIYVSHLLGYENFQDIFLFSISKITLKKGLAKYAFKKDQFLSPLVNWKQIQEPLHLTKLVRYFTC